MEEQFVMTRSGMREAASEYISDLQFPYNCIADYQKKLEAQRDKLTAIMQRHATSAPAQASETTGEPSIKIASGRDAAEWEQNQAEQRMQEKSQSAARKTPSLRNEPLTNILDEQSIADWMRDEAIEKEALRELFAAIQGLDLESNYVVDGKCHADRARIAVKRPR